MAARIDVVKVRRWLPLALLFAACAGGPAAAQAPTLWDRDAARELLGFGRNVGTEGLDPADYRLTELEAALDGPAPGLDAAATRSFALLVRDLADGRVRPPARGEAHFPYPTVTPQAVEAMMDLALATRTVTASLNGLLPASADYRALRAALAATPADAAEQRMAIRVNLDRWRWLPREGEGRWLLVNVPAFEVRLIAGGETLAIHRVIVGKARTPTPQFAASVTGVIINPDWNVPDSIIAESVGKLVRTRPDTARKRGYSWSTDGNGRLRVVQKPGPENALGQLKLVMPNPWSIYLHDTPAKTLFDRSERAFSHGCIRTQEPHKLAARLLEGTDWDLKRIDATMASGAQVTAPLAKPMPVVIGYFTAVADESGAVRLFKDVYKRDAAVAAALGPGPAPGGAVARALPRDEVCGLG
jgi:murein L,D-transpeptidase YcbB/YkuD